MVSHNTETILLIGAGSLGRAVLDELRHVPPGIRVVATARDVERLQRYLNLLLLEGAVDARDFPLEAIHFDLDQPDSCREAIVRLSPRWIMMTATRQTWWLPQLFSDRIRRQLRQAGYGPWLPIHLDLTRRLMKILREIEFQGITLTASYPDVVNCVLARQGLAPTAGFGNIEELVARVRLAAARHFAVSLELVEVRMVAHHALEASLSGRGERELPPWALEICVAGGAPVDGEVARKLLTAPLQAPLGPATHALTAACAVRLLRAIREDRGELVHVPGVLGLPGGYPVRFRGGLPQVELFGGLGLDQMIEINRASQPFDGIDSIESDGTVVFSEPGVEVMRRMLGYHCPRLEPDTVGAQARELVERFAAFAASHGVDLARAIGLAGG